MHRRSFLRTAVVGSALVGSGCQGLFGGSETGTPTDTPEPALRVVERDLVDADGDDAYAELRVENVADRALGEVAATVRFLADGEVQTSRTGFANGLSPGQQWLTAVSSGTGGVDEFEVAVEERTGPGDLETDHLDIVEDELGRRDDAAFVEAVARNASGEPLEDVEIACTFTDGDGLVLGNAFVDVVGAVGADEDYEFSVRYTSPVRPAADVGGYRLTATARTDG